MDNSLSRQLAKGATLIVDDRLAAAQLEAYLLCADSGRSAWPTPAIHTHSAWVSATLTRQSDARRLVIGSAQSEAIWQRIVAASPEGATLIEPGRVAAWASAAWRRLLDWQLSVRELRAAPHDVGFGSFLRWAREFEDILAGSAWLDAAQTDAALAAAARAGRLTAMSLVWVDTRLRTPALENLTMELRAAGCDIRSWQPPTVAGSVRRAALADRRQEIIAAALWARRKLANNPCSRIALVIPPDRESELLLARCFESDFDPAAAHGTRMTPVWLDGEAAVGNPAIGGALACLELFGSQGDFGNVSRWLRSPFLGESLEDRASRSAVEADLRSDLMAQVSFVSAYRAGGLRSWLAGRVPDTARAIDALLERLDAAPRTQSATRWTELFQQILERFGWPGTQCIVPQRALDGWNRILGELTLLTPILGNIGFEQALAELRVIAERFRVHAARPLAGLTILTQPELVGPGYDAAWVAGMSDRVWPRAAQPNPLLPIRLQADHRMPFATPESALASCREITARLIDRVPELVFSHPLVEDDIAAAPSPLIRALEPWVAEVPPPKHDRGRSRAPASLEHIDDPVPPLDGAAIAGGARTLVMQARCPLRAVVESRLDARPLERVPRGIGARQRGIITHRALELLFVDCRGRRDLAGYSADERARRIGTSARQAVWERAGVAPHSLRVFLRLEEERLARLLAAMLAAELERSDFTIEGLEIRRSAHVAGLEIACRIDRLDRLAGGRFAIIDYKTGQRATPNDWLRARLIEPQLPLYLQVVSEDVGALVIVHIQATGLSYRGLWDVEGAFPGRPHKLPAGVEWNTQQHRWFEQLEQLVTEYARGDARLFLADPNAAAGPFAPLTRVCELIALGESVSATHDA